MRRQRRMQHTSDNNYSSSIDYAPLNNENNGDFLLTERATDVGNKQAHRFENTIEAKVEEGDTLQALALRFHCSVADIKRLNKIDKDNEIHARKVLKIPVNVHTVLLGTLPTVHTSGNSSPKRLQDKEPDITRNPLEDASALLDEKLLVASVSNSSVINNKHHINNVVMNSKIAAGRSNYTDEEPRPSTSRANNDTNDATLPLICDILDDERTPHMRHIPGPSMMTFDWSGSDCDMSWICLFIGILALCFVIPLIYVIYLAEHPHHHNQHTNVSVAIINSS